MLIVPGGNVVAAGLMVVTSTAGVASVALELEDRIAKEGQLKLDRRLAMDVLQVIAISLPFGTLTKTFAEAALVGKGRFLLCMTGFDAAQGFIIAADVKQQLAVIEANTAVQLAGATSDEQRKAIHAERDRRIAEVIGGAVVNGGFLLVSLGHGIKRAIAITRAGAKFTVREPVCELVKQGRERMEQALSTDTFEHEGQRVQLTDDERRYLEHEIAAGEAAPPSTSIGHAADTAKPDAAQASPETAHVTGEMYSQGGDPTEHAAPDSEKKSPVTEPPDPLRELQTLGADRAKAITDHLDEPLVRRLLAEGATAADLDTIANVFTAEEVRGCLGEQLVPGAISELAALDPATRSKLLGPGNLNGTAAHDLLAVIGKHELQILANTLTGREILALRSVLSDDALLSRIVGIGGAQLRDVVGEIGAPDVKVTVKALTPERFVELSDAGLIGSQLQRLAAEFTGVELTTLETVMSRQQLAVFYASSDMGKTGLGVILECARLSNIKGLKDWVGFTSAKKNTADWRNGIGELREALRVAKADPTETVEVDADAHTPTKSGQYSPQGTPLDAKSFDLTVRDSATGSVKRSVEATSCKSPVTKTKSIADGIAHATQKLLERDTMPVDAPGHQSGTPLPIPGVEKDVVIQLELFHGEMDPVTGAQTPAGSPPGTFPPHASSRKSVVFDGLGGYSAQDYAPQRPASAGPKEFPAGSYDGGRNPGNIFDNLLRNLNAADYAKANVLKRLRIVGFDGSPIALFEQDAPGVWSRK